MDRPLGCSLRDLGPTNWQAALSCKQIEVVHYPGHYDTVVLPTEFELVELPGSTSGSWHLERVGAPEWQQFVRLAVPSPSPTLLRSIKLAAEEGTLKSCYSVYWKGPTGLTGLGIADRDAIALHDYVSQVVAKKQGIAQLCAMAALDPGNDTSSAKVISR